MQLFDIINEVAVLGITFFMLAVSTVWYSSVLFGSIVWKGGSEQSTRDTLRMLTLTAISYAVALALLAYVLAFAPVFLMSSLTLAISIAVFAGALLAPYMIWEGKKLSEYIVHVGFAVLFIIGGALLLQYWPW